MYTCSSAGLQDCIENDVVLMATFQQMVLASMYAHQYMYIHVVQIVAGNSTEFLLFSN